MTLTKQFTAQRSAGPNARIRATVAGQRTDTVRRAPVADEPRVSPRIIAAIQTTTARAATLVMDGYTIEPIDAFKGLFFVRRPNPLVDRNTGEVTEGYEVNVIDGTCTCPMFCRAVAATGDGVCKHVLSAREEVRKAFRLLGLLPDDDEVAEPQTAEGDPWEVWEYDPQMGDLPGRTYPSREAAQAAANKEEDDARAWGERVPILRIRPAGERRNRVVWGEGK